MRERSGIRIVAGPPLVRRSRKHTTPYCATPDCYQQTPERFCLTCSERLARVRETLEADAQWKEKRTLGRSTCCRVGCKEPRVPPAHFCAECDMEMSE